MRLSDRANADVQAAAKEFADRVIDIITRDTSRSVADQLRDHLTALMGGAATRGRPRAPVRRHRQPASKRAPRRFSKRAGALAGRVEELVSVVRQAGGRASPSQVSEAMGLSKEQRGKLVRAAVEAGALKQAGRTRSSVYSLP